MIFARQRACWRQKKFCSSSRQTIKLLIRSCLAFFSALNRSEDFSEAPQLPKFSTFGYNGGEMSISRE